jgi:hypothetical protein
MMDSQHQNWAVHLQGAREIYNLLFYPQAGDSTREAQRIAETDHPLRTFLVSLLSYLDVAGACASPGGTVVEGTYWKTMGGDWEYNLGTPSLLSTMPDNPNLGELRQAWSSLMEVQASISTFASDKKTWMTADQSDMTYKEIFNQLVVWRAMTPPCLRLLADLDDESLAQYPCPEVLEYAGCIEAYEKATFVHLLQVAGAGRVGWITDWTYMNMLVSRILQLICKLSKGVGKLAVVWPLFIAGQETRNECEQKYVRETMQDLKRFGFRVCLMESAADHEATENADIPIRTLTKRLRLWRVSGPSDAPSLEGGSRLWRRFRRIFCFLDVILARVDIFRITTMASAPQPPKVTARSAAHPPSRPILSHHRRHAYPASALL